MTDKELENLLKSQGGSDQIPDVKDKVLFLAEGEKLFEINAQKTARKRKEDAKKELEKSSEKGFFDFLKKPFGKVATGFLALVIICSIIIPIALNNSKSIPTKTEEITAVCMQINPSVELEIKDGFITGAKGLNKDGVVLLVNASLVGMAAEDGCLWVAQAASAQGLITERGITLYVSGKDEADLENRISNKLKNSNFSLNKGGANRQNKAEDLAKKYKISQGKARVVAEILSLFPNYDEKALCELPSEELFEILEDYREGEMDEFEAHLMTEYQAQFEQYKASVKGLLEKYETDLEELNTLSGEELLKKIRLFNVEYEKLGEDFLIDENEIAEDGWEEVYEECKEEILEIAQEFKENEKETFADLFEDWLEDFQGSRFDRDDD